MKTLILLAVLCSSSFAVAATVPLDLRFETLTLRNGKVLKSATIKSHDPAARTVMIAAQRSLTAVQIELLPEDVAAQVRQLAPARPDPKPVKAAKPAPVAAASKSSAREEEKTLAAEVAHKAKQENERLVAVRAAAQQAAIAEYGRRSAFTGYVANPSVQIGAIEPVPGWEGRYRVKGTRGLRKSTQYGTAKSARPTEVEIVVQVDESGGATVVDFVEKEPVGI